MIITTDDWHISHRRVQTSHRLQMTTDKSQTTHKRLQISHTWAINGYRRVTDD